MSAFMQSLATSWWLIPAVLAVASFIAAAIGINIRRRDKVRVFAVAEDPGNPGHEVKLLGRLRAPGRWLEVQDGTAPHRTYRIPTGSRAVDPITAIAATYGLSHHEYLRVAKRS